MLAARVKLPAFRDIQLFIDKWAFEQTFPAFSHTTLVPTLDDNENKRNTCHSVVWLERSVTKFIYRSPSNGPKSHRRRTSSSHCRSSFIYFPAASFMYDFLTHQFLHSHRKYHLNRGIFLLFFMSLYRTFIVCSYSLISFSYIIINSS